MIEKVGTDIQSLHLVSGSAVEIRHYPVTVSAENRARGNPATGSEGSREGRSNSPKRKSGDRPDGNLGLIQLRWESWKAFLSVAKTNRTGKPPVE